MVKRFFCLTALLAVLIASGYQAAWAQSHPFNQKPVYPTIQQYGPFTNTGINDPNKDPKVCNHNACLFYGGNFLDNPNFSPYLPNALANMNTVFVEGVPYGAATWVPFIVPTTVDGWNVTGLFTNNFSMFGTLDQYPNTPTAAAFYSVNSGVGAGMPGTVISSGVTAATSTPTGRSAFGLTEFTIEVTGLSFQLTPGEYWMAVVGYCTNYSDNNCFDVGYLSDVEFLNGGPAGYYGQLEPIDAAYFDGFYGIYSFYPAYGPMGACGGYGCDAFSAGVLGSKY
jgi:hypothetical protein